MRLVRLFKYRTRKDFRMCTTFNLLIYRCTYAKSFLSKEVNTSEKSFSSVTV